MPNVLRSVSTRRGTLGMLAAGAVATHPVLRGSYGEGAYRRALVIDAMGGFNDPANMDQASRDAKASGLTAVSITVGQVGNGPSRLQSVFDDIATADAWLARYPDVFIHVRRSSDVRAAKASGRTGVIYNIQDTTSLEGDLTRVKLLKDIGVRIVQLTYNKRNLCGDGCLEPEDAGVSDFGRQVIGEINARRLVLDLSHGGRRTISEAAKASKLPPAVTHTGCRDLVDNQRNIFDAQLREIADLGGVVGIYLIAYLRSGIGQPALEARREDLIAHLEHAVNVCGEDHVGIGTDGDVSAFVIDATAVAAQKKKFEMRTRMGIATAGEGPDIFNYIPEYNTPRRFLTLADDLARRGWSATKIEKIIGGNFARLFSETWDA